MIGLPQSHARTVAIARRQQEGMRPSESEQLTHSKRLNLQKYDISSSILKKYIAYKLQTKIEQHGRPNENHSI
jgi:hypothetical protein